MIRYQNIEIIEKENLAKYTTIGIGGDADYFIRVDDKLQLFSAIEWAQKNNLPITVLGRGSKTLISDKGIRGVVLVLAGMDSIVIDDRFVYVEAGASLIRLANLAISRGLRGLEWAVGIPASVGGALVMNAGAYGGSISDCVLSVEVYNGSSFETLANEDCDFSYRKSVFMQRPEYIITSAKLGLVPDKKERLEQLAAEYKSKRAESQPSGKTLGSAFKKMKDGIAPGEILDKAGLKGYTIGGAMISSEHANFIINKGNATCQDVLMLLEYMQEIIYQKTGMTPELEIRVLGEF
ncbi:MAG TPA: UDP-N-acetylmuramate dehydrogenase [Clostridia bacterium]|jgi:UDP-N-acetylmuramate dehydrogenase